MSPTDVRPGYPAPPASLLPVPLTPDVRRQIEAYRAGTAPAATDLQRAAALHAAHYLAGAADVALYLRDGRATGG